jgi:transcriptional regulator with XRE-family HTH domain
MESEERDFKEKFGRHLSKLRKQRGLSQERLGDLCGLDRTYIGGVERGERNVSLVSIIRIASGLNVEAAELFAPFGATGGSDA